MPELTTDVADSLRYFAGGAIRCNPPASEPMINDAEQQLGLTFPPSMREILRVHNGFGLIDCRVLSIHPPGEEGVVKETLYYQQVLENDKLIAIARDASGDVFVLLADKHDERGEYPVAQVDHETGRIMFIVGSCYERFLWFLLDRLQREFEPDGKDKGLWDYPEDDEEEWDEPVFPWPSGDKEWMKQRDPHLAQWLNSDER